MPEISVIMNCLNGEEFLREAIDSVYAQTYEDWEIVFWDNQSTDSSAEIAKSYDERMSYYMAPEFLPIGAARNEAIKQARGRYIAFLDTDDIWTPEHLALRLSAFEAASDKVKDLAMIYGSIIIRDETSGTEYKPFNPERDFHSGTITAALCKGSFIWLQAVLIKKQAIEALDHVFDPVLMTAEDLDFLIRLSVRGRFEYINEATVYYRVHEKNITASRRRYFSHDFSYLLEKYAHTLEKPMLRDIARQYLMNIRIDLGGAGFWVFPFVRLGLTPKQMAISLLHALFPGKQTLELKNMFKKPLDFLHKLNPFKK